MRVLNVKPVDVIAELEIRMKDLKKLKMALDNCEITVSKEIEGSWEARDYVINEFYPELSKLIEEFKDVT